LCQLCRIGVSTFVAATAIGIVSSTFSFALLGAGQDSAMAAEEAAFKACRAADQGSCSLHFDPTAAAAPQLIIALVALGIVALSPIAVKRFKANAVDLN
jgi:hypothetical protein